MSKKLRLPNHANWKNDIDYWDKLSEEDRNWLSNVVDTEYSRSNHDDYSKNDMKRVYSDNNSSEQCIISTQYNPTRPSIYRNGEIIGSGKEMEDIYLDIENMKNRSETDLYDLWKVNPIETIDECIVELSRASKRHQVIYWYVQLTKVLKWERTSRRKEQKSKHSDSNPESLDS